MTRPTPGRYFGFLGAIAGALLLVILVSPGIGTDSAQIGLSDVWRAVFEGRTEDMAYRIGIKLRLPRTLLALQAGVTLGLCGAVFQVIFRNPLATPYTLGVASGGSLGALVVMKFSGASMVLASAGVSLGAFVGALAVIGVLLLFMRAARRISTTELLLSGVTIGLFCSAMMMFLQYLSTERETHWIVRWMMGSVTSVGSDEAMTSLPILLPCWIVLVLTAKALNQYVLGEEIAISRGVHVARLQVICILFTSLATAAVVAQCGPIGFVGLVVPQLTGLLVGRDCRLLLPASGLVGGVFLVVCDWISQLVLGWVGSLIGLSLGSVYLPTGVVTALVGVPIFLGLLYRRFR